MAEPAVRRGLRAAAVCLGVAIGGLGIPPAGLGSQDPVTFRARPAAPDTSFVTLEIEVRGETGESVSSASVVLRRFSDRIGVRDPEMLSRRGPGLFAIRVAAGGRGLLRATAPGYAPVEEPLPLDRPGRRYVKLVLPVDPVHLPDILALGRLAPAGHRRGHSIEHVRFADRTLAGADVGSWLETLPGVVVRRKGAGLAQVVSVRGARPAGVLVLLDGVPLNDPVTGTADLSRLPVSTLESATLVRGTGSGAYGSGALGGVVLLRSRAPAGSAASVGAAIGSLGSRRADLFVSAAGRGSGIALSAAHERSENDFRFRNRTLPGAPVERRRNADGSRSSLAVTARGESRLRPRIEARYDRTERGSPGRIGSRLFDDARWAQEAVRIGFGLGRTGGASAGAVLRRQRIAFTASTGDSREEIWDARLTGNLRVPGLGLRLAGRLERETVDGDGLEGVPGRWSGGGRIERPLEAEGLEIAPSVALDAARGTRALSPELSVARTWPSGVQGWARIGRGFRLPTFGDLYFASSYGVRSNPDLRAEVVTLDGEIGASVPLRVAGRSLRARIVLHGRRTRDPIVWLASSAAVWSPRNLEALRSVGIEGSVRLDDAGAPWTGGLWIAGLRSRLGFGSNRNSLPYEPDLSGGAMVERRWSAMAVRGELRVTGSRTTSIAGTRRLPVFATLDLAWRGSLKFLSVPASIQLTIDNLLDERYELVELFPEPGRTAELRLQFH
ncbi:MAG: TonB-dependent receptor [Gemmatimonadota bacterium]